MPTMLFLLMDFVPTTLLKIEDKTSAEVAFLVSVPVVDLFDEDDKILPRRRTHTEKRSHISAVLRG